MQTPSNIIDKPRKEGAADLLGVDKYTDALIQFIESAQMPTTLAIQGEWGSGKTSLLNQIRYRLCEAGTNSKAENDLKPYYGIWVNTWQYSLMKSKDEALIAIIGGLTNEILAIIKDKHETKSKATINKVKGLFAKLGKAGAKAAASTVGLEGDIVDSLFDGQENEVNLLHSKQLYKMLSMNAWKKIVNKEIIIKDSFSLLTIWIVLIRQWLLKFWN